MSKYTSFPEPMEDQNPFQDPAVTQHSSNTGYATLDLYNPFDNTTAPPPPYEATPPSAPAPSPPVQTPPSRTTPTEPRNYGSYNSQPVVNAATAELMKKQEELEKKAQELERRERELAAHSVGPGASRQNNWPPLPSFCPVGPCFYQDINVEISQRFQRTVTIMYYFWLFCTGTLVFNLISSLALFCINQSGGVGVGLGLAILWVLLFTPCSFICWYRPMYKAFRSDSSFNFFAFFFVFFAQVIVFIIMTIGIPGWGFRSTVCTGKPMPAFRRPRLSSPLESCPIRRYARLLPTPLPTLPRGPSPLLDRENEQRRLDKTRRRRGALSSMVVQFGIYFPTGD
uniref:Secretory carrier-associated membrane protein n=1 Tax=Astatotilapia calliptera TaxID=8154 RepID=A0A3P8PAZ5_ASTCA